MSILLVGCNKSSDHTGDSNDGSINEEDASSLNKDSNSTDGSEDEDSQPTVEVTTGSTELVSRKIEGMDSEVEVINYDIQPYDISYQLDTRFGEPKVHNSKISYSIQDEKYKITLEIIEATDLDRAVSNIQEDYAAEDLEEKGELENTPLEENHLKGKMQFFAYPIKGFYAYEIDDHVLVITYQYPEEGGDGMGPLLEALRKSLTVS